MKFLRRTKSARVAGDSMEENFVESSLLVTEEEKTDEKRQVEGGQVLSGLTFLVLVPTSLLRGLHDMEKSLLL